MRVNLHVTDGYLGIECQGILPEPPKKIVFDRNTRTMSLYFRTTDKVVTIDCPIDDEMMEAMDDHKMCGIGCFEGDKKLSAALVPFEQVQ